jgi:hypothetical protein
MARKKCKCGKALATQRGGLCRTCEKQALTAGSAGRVEMRKVAALEAHPLNAETYAGEPADEWAEFVRDVGAAGVKEPLQVTPEGVIIGGHRRWAAAAEAGFAEVPCIVEDIGPIDGDDARERLVRLNKRRTKTKAMTAGEALILHPIERRKALDRQARRGPLPDTYREVPAGEAWDEVAKQVGFGSGRTCKQACDVVLRVRELRRSPEDEGRVRAEVLAARLEESVQAAWDLMRTWDRPAAPPDLPDAPADVEFDKEVNDMIDGGGVEPEPQDKEDADLAFGPDLDWPAAPFTKEDVDGLAGADMEREAAPDQAGLSPGPAGAGQDAPAPPPQRVRLDPFGVPLYLQPGAHEAFDAAERMADLADEFRSAGRALARLVRQPGAEALVLRGRVVDGRSVDADAAVLALTETMPACCRCPECHSRGLAANGPGCGVCRGRPYVTAHALAAVDRRKIDALCADLAVTPPGAAAGEPAAPGGVASLPAALDTPAFREAIEGWIQHRKERKKPVTPTAVSRLLARAAEMGEARAVAAINYSVSNGWDGVFESPKSRADAARRGPGQIDMDEVRADLDRMGLAS